MAAAHRARRDRGAVAVARRPRARAQRVSRARLRARGRPGVRPRRRGRPGVVAGLALPADGLLSGADRAPPLWGRVAGAGRLDPSFCAARHAADRSGRGRGGNRRLARSPGEPARPPRLVVDAVSAGERTGGAGLRGRARAARRKKRRARRPSARPPGARRRTRALSRRRHRGQEAQGAAAAKEAPGRHRSSGIQHRHRGFRDGGGARRFHGAGSGRLERPRRHRGARRRAYPHIHARCRHRPRPRRQGTHRPALCRRAADRRPGDAAQRRDRVVLEDRL